ncbi:MAG: selenium cofactor biosynthesis protein YqeC [Halodesulfurarchaeum sp.]
MELARALDLGDRELVSFVGAGGKKTSMARLVEEGRARVQIGYTTTTHMPPPESIPLFVADPGDLEDRLESADTPVAFASERVANPARVDAKVTGFRPATLDSIFEADLLDWIVVKADGARMREFKAPGDGEPAVPGASTLVVPVVSAKIFGRPLGEAAVHRPERVAAIADVERGTEITPELVGEVLASADGGLKGVPQATRVAAIINKADGDDERDRARGALEAAFARSDRFERGLVTSFETETLDVIRP